MHRKAVFNRREGLKIAGSGVLTALVSAVGWGAQAQQPADADAADAIFDLLPDWSGAGISTPMTMSDLVNLKDAAIAFLKRIESGTGAALEDELRQYADGCCKPGGPFDAKKASGLFLLFRVIFELPDLTGASEVRTFGGWYAAEDARGVKEKRESDDFHPSWPVYVARISNKLYIRADNNPGSIGSVPAYRIMDEYLYMRNKFKFRNSSYLRGLEFIFIADR